MKKRASATQLYQHRHPMRWLPRSICLVATVVFLVFFLKSFFQMTFDSSFGSLDDSSSSSSVQSVDSTPRPPKIAFLFLARKSLPLDSVWQSFFQGAQEPNFSIYIHSRPGYKYDEKTTLCTFCRNRQLINSIQVGWGEASMIEAERLLFKKALQDSSNQRFVLVSDSCAPLYNFSFTYDYLMSSSKSFVDCFLDTKGERYHPKMAPVIPKTKWRKGSQWVVLIRKHAQLVVSDNKVITVFKKFCKRRPPLPAYLRKNPNVAVVQKEHNCIPDEHYVPTLLAMTGLEEELERRTLTYTSWKEPKSKVDTQGWHPETFKYSEVDGTFLSRIKEIDHVYYSTEYRAEWCKSGGKPHPCFLFARKFSRSAAPKLLQNISYQNSTIQDPATISNSIRHIESIALP